MSGVKLCQLQHWYSDIGGQDIGFGQLFIQQDFDNWYTGMVGQFLKSKNADLPFFTLIFSLTHLLFFVLTLTKAYFEAGKQIFFFVNNAENRGGSRNFIHQITAKI